MLVKKRVANCGHNCGQCLTRSACYLANLLAVVSLFCQFISTQTGKVWQPGDWVVLLIFSIYGISGVSQIKPGLPRPSTAPENGDSKN